MDSREETLKALREGKVLTSAVTGIRYTQVDGLLYARSSEHKDPTQSGLKFFNPSSWQNLRD